MNTTALLALLATFELDKKYSIAEAQKAYALCLHVAKGDEARAKNYFIEILADHSYKASVEASKRRLLNI